MATCQPIVIPQAAGTMSHDEAYCWVTPPPSRGVSTTTMYQRCMGVHMQAKCSKIESWSLTRNPAPCAQWEAAHHVSNTAEEP